jgi:creatinine amidohydrolase
MLFPAAKSPDIAHRTIAVLPVGAFEQHGPYLPLVTDTLIACEIARRAAELYDLVLLPPVCFSCSHEHAAFPGTRSLSPSTLAAVIGEIRSGLARSGIRWLVIVNGHGGNSVLTNVVQSANIDRREVLLYPTSYHWTIARESAGCATTSHQDMHAGEAETSILLAAAPEFVAEGWQDGDHEANDRSLLTLLGMAGYTQTGIIGRPSLANAKKGRGLLDSLVAQLAEPLELLTAPDDCVPSRTPSARSETSS